MIESKPHGLLSLLDDECKLPKGSDDSWARKVYKESGGRWEKRVKGSKKERAENAFTIVHYAGKSGVEREREKETRAKTRKRRDKP